MFCKFLLLQKFEQDEKGRPRRSRACEYLSRLNMESAKPTDEWDAIRSGACEIILYTKLHCANSSLLPILYLCINS